MKKYLFQPNQWVSINIFPTAKRDSMYRNSKYAFPESKLTELSLVQEINLL